MRFVKKRGSELNPSEVEDVLDIFHVDQKHDSKESKARFEDRWMGPYLKDLSIESYFYLAIDEKEKVQSYLVSGYNSQDYIKAFEGRLTSYKVFEDLFRDYPAHLHINNAPSTRGTGLGSKLMQFFLEDLKAQDIPGVHLVTTPEAKNVGFYIKNGFSFQQTKLFAEKTELLFMGQLLQD